MLNLTLEKIAELSNGKLNNEKFSDKIINLISIDTRTLDAGEMYMPIVGENFDGHIFIEKAIEKKATAVFSNIDKYHNDDFPIIYVEDTSKALKVLAKNYRKTLNTKIIGITGSNGKTSTKDLIASVLSKKYNIEKTLGNLNNQIGLPKTILNISKDTEIGVVEMGTDSFGEIEILSNIAKPNISIITNIGDSHLEKLLTKENIAKEKLHIIDGMPEDGIFLYNLDDEILSKEFNRLNINNKILTFGQSKDANFRIKFIESNNNGNLFSVNDRIYNISLIGKHQVYNATIAIAIGEILGVDYEDIKNSLMQNQSTEMRTELMSLDGFDILNDSYKSNPQSLLTAISTLKILEGYSRKIAILGDMLELGEEEADLHRNIGKQISSKEIDYLLLYGPLSKYIAEESIKNFPKDRVFYFNSKEKLIDKAKFIINRGSIVLVKASRSMHLEEIIESISVLHVK